MARVEEDRDARLIGSHPVQRGAAPEAQAGTPARLLFGLYLGEELGDHLRGGGIGRGVRRGVAQTPPCANRAAGSAGALSAGAGAGSVAAASSFGPAIVPRPGARTTSNARTAGLRS